MPEWLLRTGRAGIVLKIGYLKKRYPERRNILNQCNCDHAYVRIARLRQGALSLARAAEVMAGRFLGRSIRMNNDLHAVYRPVRVPDVDVIHTFNTVCDTPVPWVATFETMIPRTNCLCTRAWETGMLRPDRITAYGYQLLAKDSCKALIALSEASKGMEIRMMQVLGVEQRQAIADKIVVLAPPQPALISHEALAAKFARMEACVECIFIGGLFYRKGGAQMLDAMEAMVKKGMRLHLTVVSTLTDDGFAKISKAEKARYARMLSASPWITHYRRLSNAQVLELCKKAHVGLLPSMADTYGYAVLEMQACGCAVITTNIRAMPEINNNSCGYVIPVPLYPSTEARYDAPGDLETLKETIDAGLCRALHEIWQEPARVQEKARAALLRIETEHAPEAYARRLSAIYQRASRR